MLHTIINDKIHGLINSLSSLAYEAALLKALSPFEKAYISRSQARLLESINQVFGNTARGLPREEEILSIAKSFTR